MRARLCISLALALVGCGAREHAEAPPRSTTPPSTDGPATCMPGGLEAAHAVEMVRLPAGCSFTGGGPVTAPTVVADDEALSAHIQCASEPSPTISVGDGQIALVSYTMSPAFGGMAIVDDGTTVTFVTRDRPPCPGDPMPMPTPASAIAFRLPRGATRTYTQAACSLPRRCD